MTPKREEKEIEELVLRSKNKWHNMHNMTRVIFLLSLFLVFPFIAPSSANAFLAPTSGAIESLGESTSNTSISSGLIAEVNQTERNDRGNLISVTWSLENPSEERVVITWMAGRTYRYEGPYFSGVTVSTSEEGTRFHPVMDGIGNCLCSGNHSPDFRERSEPGGKVSYWSL